MTPLCSCLLCQTTRAATSRRWAVRRRLGLWFVFAPDGSVRDYTPDWRAAIRMAHEKANRRTG